MENFQPELLTENDIENISQDFFHELGSTVSDRTRKEYRMICKQILRALKHNAPFSPHLSKAKFLQVRSVIGKLKEQHHIPADVQVRGIPTKWTKHGNNGASSKKKKDDAFTEDTFKNLISEIENLPAKKQNKQELLLASTISFRSGMRLQEILDIQPEHITCDPHTHEVTIYIESGKGDESREAYLPKSMHRAMKKFQPFTIKHSYVIWIFWKLKKAGIISGTFHALRHGFAFTMKEQGCDIVEIQELLGHVSIDTTEKHYYPKMQGRPAAMKRAGY